MKSLKKDNLPVELEICGQKCPIRSDFRTWIKVSEIVSKKEFNARITLDLIRLVFINIPPNFYEALRAMIGFYNPNKEGEAENKQGCDNAQKLMKREVNADYIHTAFMQQYGIDLRTADLHWWEFKTMFDRLFLM